MIYASVIYFRVNSFAFTFESSHSTPFFSLWSCYCLWRTCTPNRWVRTNKKRYSIAFPSERKKLCFAAGSAHLRVAVRLFRQAKIFSPVGFLPSSPFPENLTSLCSFSFSGALHLFCKIRKFALYTLLLTLVLLLYTADLHLF